MTTKKTPMRAQRTNTLTCIALFAAALFAGCTTNAPSDCGSSATIVFPDMPTPIHDKANQCALYQDAGFDGTNWPDLSGHELVILDHGAFDWAFEPAKEAFEARTGATVTHVGAADTGSALNQAIQDQATGGSSFDILYGIDNVLMGQAANAGIFEPYTPLLAERVASEHRFAPTQGGAWLATPVDHGFIGINIDPRAGVEGVEDFDDLITHADQFVTSDPRFSTPGLGFLVSTVAVYGESGYLDYWQSLFDAGATVEPGWTEAYVNRFSGGYGQWEDGTLSDKAIVVSYTTSPAYELSFGEGTLNEVMLAADTTFQQVQTMGILNGGNRIAAEAWIEFTLTDDFQNLAAGYNAIYPVVETPTTAASVSDVYQGRDPQPGTFTPAPFTSKELSTQLPRWVSDWTDLYEDHLA